MKKQRLSIEIHPFEETAIPIRYFVEQDGNDGTFQISSLGNICYFRSLNPIVSDSDSSILFVDNDWLTVNNIFTNEYAKWNLSKIFSWSAKIEDIENESESVQSGD